MALDLHQHSVYSDGTDTVADLVRRAVGMGLSAMSLTDHDTIAGVEECRELAAQAGIRFVAGVEFESWEGPHILGYFKNGLSGPAERAIAAYRQMGAEFVAETVRRLKEAGYALDLNAVLLRPGPGTPHVGHVVAEMRSRGALSSLDRTNEEYRSVFGPGAPAERPSWEANFWGVASLIRALRDSGAVTVLAHPSNPRRLDLWPEMVAAGLQGVEAYHRRNHVERNIPEFARLAEDRGLIVTGGWDHHGEAQAAYLASVNLDGFAPPDALLGPLLDLIEVAA